MIEAPTPSDLKPPAASEYRWGSLRRRFYLLGPLLLIPIVILPMYFLVYGSFRTASPGLGGTWTLDNWGVLFDADFAKMARNSVLIAVGSTAFGMVIALALALCVARLRVPGAKWLDSFIVSPAYLPPLVGAIAWQFILAPKIGFLANLLTAMDIPVFNLYSLKGIIFVIGLYNAPLAYLYLRPALLSMNASLEEAGRIFGANRGRVLRSIIVPLMMPALLSATTILFVTALGEFAVPSILGSKASIDVISTQILMLTTADTPPQPGKAAVLGVLLAVITVACLVLSNRMLRGRDFTTVGVKGAVSNHSYGDFSRWIGFAICFAYVVIALVLPILVLVVGSFQPYLSPSLASGWTLNNYVKMWQYPGAATSIWNSIQLSIGAALVAAVLAFFLGTIVVRRGGQLGRIVDYIASIPLAVPHVVFGLAMVWAWVGIPLPVYGTKWILLLAFIGLFLPYVMRAAVSGFRQLDPVLEEAGRMGGANSLGVARRIVTPLLIPAVLSGITIVVYHGMREISASLFLYGPDSTVMPVMIWEMTNWGAYGILFALCTVNLAIIFVLVAVGNRLAGSQRQL